MTVEPFPLAVRPPPRRGCSGNESEFTKRVLATLKVMKPGESFTVQTRKEQRDVLMTALRHGIKVRTVKVNGGGWDVRMQNDTRRIWNAMTYTIETDLPITRRVERGVMRKEIQSVLRRMNPGDSTLDLIKSLKDQQNVLEAARRDRNGLKVVTRKLENGGWRVWRVA